MNRVICVHIHSLTLYHLIFVPTITVKTRASTIKYGNHVFTDMPNILALKKCSENHHHAQEIVYSCAIQGHVIVF